MPQVKKKNKAFTLIELLIAILIFSIIASVLYSTFYTGTSVWKRSKDATRLSMTINSVLDDLAEELRNTVMYTAKEGDMEFKGEEDKLYFCFLSGTVTEEVHYTEVYRACYYVETARKKARFDLFQKKAALIKGGFDIDEAKPRLLIASLDDFKIEYAFKGPMDEIIWEEEWEKLGEVPKAVRIGIEKDELKLTKYISIPTGKLIGSEIE